MTSPATQPDADDLQRRVIDLESKLLLLEHDFEALNAAFMQRAGILTELDNRLTRLIDQLEQGGGGEEPRSLEENKPPHY